MVETILKRLLDRDYADSMTAFGKYHQLRFIYDDITIGVEYYEETKQFVMHFHIKRNDDGSGTCCEYDVKFENELEQLSAEFAFKNLLQREMDKIVSKTYAKVMGIETEPEEQPKTFDDAQTQIVNDNVEE